MTDVIAHPMRLDGNRLATVDDEADDGAAQELAILIGTRIGERDLVPEYGIPDPTFAALDAAQINAAAAQYCREGVTVTDIDLVVDPTGTRVSAVLQFHVDDTSSTDPDLQEPTA